MRLSDLCKDSSDKAGRMENPTCAAQTTGHACLVVSGTENRAWSEENDNMYRLSNILTSCPLFQSFGRPLKGITTRNLRKLHRMFSTTSDLHRKFGQVSSKARQHSVGVIGAGRVASSVHIPNILNNHRLDLRWIVENSPEATKSLQDKLYLEIPFYTSDHTESLLNDPRYITDYICHCY